MSAPNKDPAPVLAGDLERAVARRYGGLAGSSGSLSCGGALEHGAPSAGEVVLDLGCGSGAEVHEAARRVGEWGIAIGIDLSAEMIARARAAQPGELRNVQLLRGELDRLQLADGVVDLVISNCAINHVPDKAAVYREIHRVLGPRGRFVVSDIVAEEAVPAAVREDPAAWAACYGGAVTEEEYLAAIRRAGFAAVEVMERSAPYLRHGVLLRSITVRGFQNGLDQTQGEG